MLSQDIDAVIAQARTVARNQNVFLGGHSAGTGFTARYAATDFNLSGVGAPDPGYAKVRGLVLLEGGGGTTAYAAPLTADSLDRMEAKFDGALYGANGGNGGGNLICIDFQTGKVLWDERSGEHRIPKGSIAYADDRLYFRTEDGAVLLIEPSREQYIERGRFEQPDRTDLPAWAHPVIANGKLYIRDQDLLLCYDIQAKPE